MHGETTPQSRIPSHVVDIPPAAGRSFVVKKAELVSIIDVEGQQVGDFVCFNLNNLSETFSAGRTRRNNNTLRVTKGHHLFSNLCHIMFTIEEDTCGIHDLLYPPCCRWLFENVYGVSAKTGCLEHLASIYGRTWIPLSPSPPVPSTLENVTQAGSNLSGLKSSLMAVSEKDLNGRH